MSKYHMKPFTAEEKRAALETYVPKINYSPRYSNDTYEYRHVIIPKPMVKFCPPGIMSEDVWRGLGIKQSPGWEMYMRHDPEPHVLLFRRPKDYDATHPPLGTSKLGNRMPVASVPAVAVKQAK